MQLIYTIGHSTRSLEEFVTLLEEHGVRRLADIRRYPGSRRYPHFSRDALAASLPRLGIAYAHFEDLGGRRKPDLDSRNRGLHNDQFRAYADYMATPSFHAAVDRLLSGELTTAYMCAEAVPWRCHRNLLSDEIVRRGLQVEHIIGPGSTRRHEMHKLAVAGKNHVSYPEEQGSLL